MPASQSRRDQSMANDGDDSLESERSQRPRYVIYLLTVWLDEIDNSDPAKWRFRLENPRTKTGKGFVGVEALMKGLCEVIGESGC